MTSIITSQRRRPPGLFIVGAARRIYAASLLWLAAAAARELPAAGPGPLGLAAALIVALAALPVVRALTDALSPEAVVPLTLGFVAGFAAVALVSATLPETSAALAAVAGA